MNSQRRRSISLVLLALAVCMTSLAAVNSKWPNSRKVRLAKAVGRYHAYNRTTDFYKRATPGGTSAKRPSR